MKNLSDNKLLWDDCYVDEQKSTAEKRMHHPIRCQNVMKFDKPWEGNWTNFFKVVQAPEGLRMYYYSGEYNKSSNRTEYNAELRYCMLESKDGISWTRAKIDRVPVLDIKENNVVKDSSEFPLDNFAIFYDENPNCPENEKYKATAMVVDNANGAFELYAYYSKDGKSFTRSHSMFGKQYYNKEYQRSQLVFDSVNIAFWDKDKQKYLLFCRGFHNIPMSSNSNISPGNARDRNMGIRDIRYSVSDDFIHWSTPVLLNYDTEDCPLYTNCVSKYSNDMYVGFPTRYTERVVWGDSFDELCSKENRLNKIKAYNDPRLGLAITDLCFMFSRDGKNWIKSNEAFLTPGAEAEGRWGYGCCYPSAGLFYSKDFCGGDDEVLTMFMVESFFDGDGANLYRYQIRKDGFFSRYGDFLGKKVVTKDFILDGTCLTINFETSGAGCLKVKMINEDGEVAVSDEHFGNKVDRKVKLSQDLSLWQGKKVHLEFFLKDAHIYSFNIM